MQLFFAKVPPTALASEVESLFGSFGKLAEVNLFRAWAGAKHSKVGGTLPPAFGQGHTVGASGMTWLLASLPCKGLLLAGALASRSMESCADWWGLQTRGLLPDSHHMLLTRVCAATAGLRFDHLHGPWQCCCCHPAAAWGVHLPRERLRHGGGVDGPQEAAPSRCAGMHSPPACTSLLHAQASCMHSPSGPDALPLQKRCVLALHARMCAYVSILL